MTTLLFVMTLFTFSSICDQYLNMYTDAYLHLNRNVSESQNAIHVF